MRFDFPQVELHLHLDGSFRPETVWELAEAKGVAMPAKDLAGYRDYLAATADCASVNEYLERFELPLRVMQDAAALTRITRELIWDLADRGTAYAEIRFAPQLHLERAYRNFFRDPENVGFPKFKSKKDEQSALFPYETISKSNTFETRHISLIKSLKNLKFRCSRLYLNRLRRYKDNIKSATLSKTKSGKFYLSVLMSMNEDEFRQFGHTNNRVGIDLGVKDFVITSDGEVFENKHFLN